MSHNSDSFMNSLMQTQSIMMVTLFTSLFSTMVSEFVKFMGKQIGDLWVYMISVSKKKLNTIKINKTQILDSKGFNKIINQNAQSYLDAMVEFITESKKYSIDNDTIINEQERCFKTERDRLLAKNIKIIPKTTIEIDGFIISYNKIGTNKDKDGKQLDTYTEEIGRAHV